MRKLICILCCTATLATWQSATAQRSLKNMQPEATFERGKQFFIERNYTASIDALTQFGTACREKGQREECDYMIAAGTFEQKGKDAHRLLTRFQKEYPQSNYCNDVSFMLGSLYFFDHNYSQALRTLKEVKPSGLSRTAQNAYFYQLGLSSLKTADYAVARNYFAKISTKSKEYTTAAEYYTAYINYAEQNYTLAAPIFSRLANDKDFGSSAQYYLCQIRFFEKAYNEVIAMGEKLLQEQPNLSFAPELKRLIGESYFENGDYTRAEPYLLAYVDGNENALRSTLYKLGIAQYNANKGKEAIISLSRVTTENDLMAQSAYLYLGQCYLKSNDKTNARMAFEAASNQAFDAQAQETALYNYALLLHENTFSPFDESVVVFERFLNQFPNSRYANQVNQYLTEVYLTGKNYNAALQSIAKIKHPSAQILGAKQRLLFRLGTESMANGDSEGAIKWFSQAISLGNYEPKSRAKAFFWRGECYYRNGDFTQAFNDFQTFMSTGDPQMTAMARYNMGYIRFKQHNFAQAQPLFEQALEGGNLSPSLKADACNRLGDCFYYSRDFARATNLYRQSQEINQQTGDYALFQEGFMHGLLHNYDQKIALLQQVERKYPQSDYIDDAIYEMAATRVIQKRDDDAITLFKNVITKYPQSAIARKAGVQLGLLHFNNNRIEPAITAYKQIINDYPNSEEAKVAAEDLKAVYIEKNDIEGYANYIGTLNGVVRFEHNEQDSLTFLAAERTFLNTKTKSNGIVQLDKYLRNYPQGAFAAQAHYYLGMDAYEKRNHATALPHLQYLTDRLDLPYSEDALAAVADIKFADKQYSDAIQAYRSLEKKAAARENIITARRGILLCAQSLRDNNQIIDAANTLLNDPKISPEWLTEARYYRAMALVDKKETEKALIDLKELGKDTRNIYGAQAGYLAAQITFDQGKLPDAQKQAETFLDSGTPHQYWLARTFILLSDIFITENNNFQAKQYLQSLKNNYTGKDDISSMIETRLKKISKK